MMKKPDKFSYIVGIIAGVLAASIVWKAITTAETDPQAECEHMATELWAFQQCLKTQPACQMPNGQEKFIRYHNLRDKFEAVCGEDRGDSFLSQIK